MLNRGWHSLSLCAMATFALLTACGGANPTTPTKPTVDVPPPAPQPSVAPAPPDMKAADLAAKAQKAFAALPGYRAQMRFMQKNGGKVARGLYDIAGKPARSMRIEIREGTGQGTKLLWLGAATVKVRPGGLLSPIVVDLPLDDDRLVSVRGYTLAQTNLASLLDMLVDRRGRLTHTGQQGGGDVLVSTGNHLLKGCNKMVAILDAKTHLPSEASMSDGREIVFQVKLSEFRTDRQVDLAI